MEEENSSASQSPSSMKAESPASTEVEFPANMEAESPASPVVHQDAVGLLIMEEKNSLASQSPSSMKAESPASTKANSPDNMEAESPASPMVHQEAMGLLIMEEKKSPASQSPSSMKAESPTSTEAKTPANTEAEFPTNTEVESPASLVVHQEAIGFLIMEEKNKLASQSPSSMKAESPASTEAKSLANMEAEFPANMEAESSASPVVRQEAIGPLIMEEKNSLASQSPSSMKAESPASTEAKSPANTEAEFPSNMDAKSPESTVVHQEAMGSDSFDNSLHREAIGLLMEEKNSSAVESLANTEAESLGNKEAESLVSPVVDQEAAGSSGSKTAAKKKRGRPRKSEANSSNSNCNGSAKRGRGRPKGSGKLQAFAALGGITALTAGGNFTPHLITVPTGEDISTKILSVTQWGRHAICILSATGPLSTAVIRHSGRTVRYDGRFEIISLRGSFTFAEKRLREPRGLLSVLLANPDGKVIGGVVAGSLIAGGPLQLIIGTFKENACKKPRRRHSAGSSTVVSKHGNSDLVNVPIVTAVELNEYKNCTAPTSSPSEAAHEGEDYFMDEIQNFNLASPQNYGENALQPFQPMLDQMTSPYINAREPLI